MKLDLRNPIPFDSYKGDFIQHSANFDKNRLGGEISPSLLILNHLSYIDLSMNNFSDMQFPEFLGSLKSLRYLDLSWSQFFIGMIPHHLGNLSRLQYLNLSNNALVGPIPDTLGRLISLTVLDLSFNDFDNSMLHCFSNLSSLVHMDISSNNFNSLILDALGRSTALTFLDLSDNNFHNSIGNLSTSLVSPFGCIHNNLKVLDLKINMFSGHLPNHLGEFKNQEYLDISSNSFYGPLPSSIGRLSYLRVLNTRNNQLNGNIPSSLGQLSKLEKLDLSNNSFVGMVSELHFAKLKRLNELYLSPNSLLVLNVSSQWVPPFQLPSILMASIKVGPQFPLWLKTQKNVRDLVMSNASISDTIPDWFHNIFFWYSTLGFIQQSDQRKDLEYMFNPSNKQEANAFYQENILDSMKGKQQEYTKTLKFLTSIDLSNNGIVGEIPEELMNLSGLLNLNLSGNHLKGRIPNNIGSLTQLESLDLSRNKLSGPIPPSLSSLSYLGHLNMSFNKLSGKIPTGNQLQTLDDPSIYIGNDGLCGAPLNSCFDDKSFDGDHKHADESKVADETDFLWFYTGIGPGFLVGFLGVCGTLNFKKSWRYAYFQFIENNYNWISVTIAIKFAQLRRKFNKGKFGR
ncbi:hypothetical protein ACSBR2_039542 [Camellia fascicularis]